MNLSAIPEPRKRRRKGETAPAAKGRAAIYVRVSTAEQADDNGSLESQETKCRALCVARGLDVAAVYVDPGASGANLDRPALADLRAAVEAGEIAVVVVYAVDRLSRSQADTLELLREFEKHGAGLAAASQAFDTTTPMGRAMLGMLAIFAELQRAEIAERTRVALAAKASRGEAVGRAPFGLRAERDEDGPTVFVRHPDEWPTVERILTERGERKSCQAIADGLNAEDVPTPTAVRGESRGLVKGPGQWHAATVAKLCRNRYIRMAADERVASGEAPVAI